ncbi:hypothetical protein V5N11_033617 [Cardamine amara subsp. amara]|uniref:DUF4283 domain-containing protein n=1 Tax=Cardamine amara subsp. amara TaxID=228776 RepID=A0ABD0ZFN2_CARAN
MGGKKRRSITKLPPPRLPPPSKSRPSSSAPVTVPSVSSSDLSVFSPDLAGSKPDSGEPPPLGVIQAASIETASDPALMSKSTHIQILDPASEPGEFVRPHNVVPEVNTPSVFINVVSPGSVNLTPVEEKNQMKPKWADLVKGSSSKMSKKGTSFVLEYGELCVQIPNEVIRRNHRRWDSFIIGQFHGNLPTHGALHAIFNGIWSNKTRDITVSKLGERTILIRIPNASTRARVIKQGMWQIEGQTMFVAAWAPGLTPVLPELTAVPVWMEFRDVPPHFFSEESLEHIAGLVGHPVDLHPSTANMTNLEVAKVLTIIDPTKEIPEAVNAQFANGEISRIRVTCPWLPPICKHCQEMGHSISRCPTAPILCQTCKSSTHSLEGCPRAKKQADLSRKEIPEVGKQEKTKSKSKKKNQSRKTNNMEDHSVDHHKPKEQSPIIRDKRKGKGKAIETQGVSLSPKPKKGSNLVVDIGLEELRASCSKKKKAPPPIASSKTSSSSAISRLRVGFFTRV